MDLTSPDLTVLLWTALTIGIVHTLIGPDHYLPFVSLARECGWTTQKTLSLTLICGLAHCAGSVVLGFAGIALGLGLASLEAFEALRGNAAAWLLLGFGLAYAIFGLRRYRNRREHSHRHTHADGTVHTHLHATKGQHAHVHSKPVSRPMVVSLLIVFLLGPCEALIPLLMYPAATADIWAVLQVTLVFSITTVATMLIAVGVILGAAQKIRWSPAPGVGGMVTGSIIGACGAAMLLGF